MRSMRDEETGCEVSTKEERTLQEAVSTWGKDTGKRDIAGNSQRKCIKQKEGKSNRNTMKAMRTEEEGYKGMEKQGKQLTHRKE